MNTLPKITDTELSNCCNPKPAGLKELHRIPRTLPVPSVDTSSEDVLQDESGFAVNDETTSGFIYDDLKA